MKNKSVWVMGVVTVVLVVLAAIITVIMLNNQKTVAPSTSTKTKTTYIQPKACDILSLETAQKILPGVTTSDVPASDVSSESIMVSNCNYYDVKERVGVGILVRAAKDDTGAQTNKAQFDPLPTGVQAVDGYGDKAYWDATFGQLNILKRNNWYILSSGPVVPASRTLEATKKMADVIVDKL